MKKQKVKGKYKMKFFADLNFDLNQDEVWEELSGHYEKKVKSDVPIKFHILKSLSDIGTLLNSNKSMQFTLF